MNLSNILLTENLHQYESEPYLDEVVPMFRLPHADAPFEVLISLRTDDFNRYFKSVSELYRVLSQSNQFLGYSSSSKKFTNKKWWKYHFNGGHYTIYRCGENMHIHFCLKRKESINPPSEIQVKMRITKGFKGFKPFILVGVNNTELYRTAYGYRNCPHKIQFIGERYSQKESLPF